MLSVYKKDKNFQTLEFYLRKNCVYFNDILSLIINISKCVNNIHSHNLLHCNLNPRSILINPIDKSVKLTAFRQYNKYAVLKNSDYVNNSSFINYYIPPEIMDQSFEEIGFATDIFSLGVIFSEILIDTERHINSINLVHIDPCIFKFLSDLFLKMINKTPAFRYDNLDIIINNLSLIQNYLMVKKETLNLQNKLSRIKSTALLKVEEGNKELKKITGELNRQIKSRQKYELALRKSEEKYRKLLDLLPDSVVIQKDGLLTFMNKPALNLVGAKSYKEIVGKRVKDFIIEEFHDLVDKRNNLMYSIKNSVPPIQQIVRRLDNELLDVEITSNLLDLSERSIISVVRDLSERKEAERKEKLLREAIEYDKLKTEFFANISHEFKTPLNVILSALQMQYLLLEKEDFNCPNILKYSNMMKQNSYRLIRLVNNLIDITKIDSGYISLNKSTCDIVKLVEDITMSIVDYVNSKNLNIIFDTNIEEKCICCDPDKIERILLNLLSNAIKFTNAGDSIFVSIIDKEDNLNIIIKDTGIGIPKEMQQKIFKRFTQVDKSLSRNHEGSGIGLSLVESLVSLHGGTISLKSSVEEGTEFTISFPQEKIKPLKNNTKIPLNPNSDENSRIEVIKVEFSDIYQGSR